MGFLLVMFYKHVYLVLINGIYQYLYTFVKIQIRNYQLLIIKSPL